MYDKIMETVSFLNQKIKNKPTLGIVLGSGLGNLVSSIDIETEIEYTEIPNFPLATVKGHGAKLIFGTLHGKNVVCLSGRFHFYEGYDMKEVVFPIFVFKFLGVKDIILTNACGGINTSFVPGDLMIIDDFINLMGTNPLMGVNDDRFGQRFPDMTEPFSKELQSLAMSCAEQLGIKYKKGVYAGFQGPYFETRAEIRMIGGFGADTVGMSTVPETIAANYLGMRVMGIACITNMATGIKKEKHSHQDVLDVANRASANLCKWIELFVEKLS